MRVLLPPCAVQLQVSGPGSLIQPINLKVLTRLQHLELTLWHQMSGDLLPLTNLIHLQHLVLGDGYRGCGQHSFLDVAPIFTLTQLTHLELSSVQREAQGQMNAMGPAGAGAVAPVHTSSTHAAIAGLGNLHLLQHLGFCETYVVHATTFDALVQLRQLTSLLVHSIHLPQSSCPGQILPVQSLQICRYPMYPSEMLMTLLRLPLLKDCGPTSLGPSLWLNIALPPHPGWAAVNE